MIPAMLSRHRAVNAAEAGFRVYPTFRPDSALLVAVPGTFNTWINRLEGQATLKDRPWLIFLAR